MKNQTSSLKDVCESESTIGVGKHGFMDVLLGEGV